MTYEEKRFKEMAEDIKEILGRNFDKTNLYHWVTKDLYIKGYRKASDVAREIFAEIEEIIARNITKDFASKTDSGMKLKFDPKSGMIESVYPKMRVTGYNGRQIVRLIAELKKKYESEGTE